jgi:hypothetical protein
MVIKKVSGNDILFLVAKLSIKILTMILKFLSLQFWSFWDIYNQVHKKKKDSKNYLVSTRLAF